MQSIFKLSSICLLWLLCAQVLGQDIKPEFPEDFNSVTTQAATESPVTSTTAEFVTAEPTTTEQPPTTTITTTGTTRRVTTTEAAVEIPTTTTTTTTTTEAAVEIPTTTTTTTTEAATELPPFPNSQPTTWPHIPHNPPHRPDYLPDYPPNRPHYPPHSWNCQFDYVNSQNCYLRDIESYRAYWIRGSLSSVNCYRCCSNDYSLFAGCNKLHSGRCNVMSYFGWPY